MRLSCLSATFISLGLLASVNPGSCVAGPRIVAPGARTPEYETAKRMLRDDGKEQENRAAFTDVNANELFDIVTRLAPHLEPFETNMRDVPANMRDVPANMRDVPANMRGVPANMRDVPAALSRSNEIRFPFELHDAFQRELAEFRILLNSEQEPTPEIISNLYEISVALIASLRFRFAAGTFPGMSQIDTDIMRVDVLTIYLSENDLAVMVHMSLDSNEAGWIASRIQQALFVKWYRNSETPQTVEEKLKEGNTEDRFARVIVEHYIPFYKHEISQLRQGA